ncbi:hypothetical protein AGMMS49938_00430 [Fibrobacterales bacterium]|nr:hypothetical protein AGMMS49938_00430 [Fibrobacterales bacterium]
MIESILPSKEHEGWRKLLEGQISHNFSFVAAGLCVARNIREVRRNKSEESYNTALSEVYEFFRKYERFLINDIREIFTFEMEAA